MAAKAKGVATPMNNEPYIVELTGQQWDLVVLGLEYLVARTVNPPSTTGGPHLIDNWSRRVVKRRLKECIATIEANVPDVGSGELD